ncbi:MAG: hypothetical protein Q8M83_00545 [bacterium]|nr:hypothetical protein [bacterium]
MDRKRILLIIAFTILCLLIGFGIYWILFRPIFAPPQQAAPIVTAPAAGLPAAAPSLPGLPTAAPVAPAAPAPTPTSTATGSVTQTISVTNTTAFTPAIAPDGSSVFFYSPASGQFSRLTPDGRAVLISDKVFYNVQKVTWAPSGQQAILEYPDQSKILYNFNAKTQVTLPAHWQNFSFSPNSQQIAFLSLGQQEDNRWLAIANADGSKTQAIETLGNNADKVQVAWSPNNQIIAFSRTGEALGMDSQEILFVGKNHENFKSLTANGIGFKAKWSPSGDKIVYSATSGDNDWKPQLWVAGANVDTVGQNKISLPVNTWVDKCVFGDETTLYCAVPKNLPRGAGLYQKAAENVADDIYKVDLLSGTSSLIAIPDTDFNIDNILVTTDEKELYFTDRFTGLLHKINLK